MSNYPTFTVNIDNLILNFGIEEITSLFKEDKANYQDTLKTINVTVKTLDGTFSMPAELPTDITIGTFKGEAQAQAGLSSVPCLLWLKKNNIILEDSDTFASASIPDKSVLVLLYDEELITIEKNNSNNSHQPTSGFIYVTIRTEDNTFNHSAEVRTDMEIGTLKALVQAKAGLSDVPCDLILEKYSTILREKTFVGNGIPDRSILILHPQGCGC